MKKTLAEVEAHPVFQALDPRGADFVTARYLPAELNPFARYGIKMAALTLTLSHMKTVPAWQMLLEDFKNGVLDDVHHLDVDSSGNTVLATAALGPAYGLMVTAIMSSDVPSAKIDVLRAFGNTVNVMQVNNVVETAEQEGNKPGHYHLDQYSHPGNPRAHELYTGPAIVRALGREPALLGIAMGSTGTGYGLQRFFMERSGSSPVIGARPKSGEQVPGARDEKRIAAVVKFPWQEIITNVVEVGRHEAFVRTRQLWSAVQPQPGPTSGLAWAGLELYMSQMEERVLEGLSGETVAFLCPDDGRFYTAPILAELDPHEGAAKL
jgi:cysteine synthase